MVSSWSTCLRRVLSKGLVPSRFRAGEDLWFTLCADYSGLFHNWTDQQITDISPNAHLRLPLASSAIAAPAPRLRQGQIQPARR
jgi:hypothetical protein